MKRRITLLGALLWAAAPLSGKETAVATLNLRETLQATWAVPAADTAAGGGPLRVGRVTFARGFGTAGGSRLELALGGRATRVQARTGVDDTAGELATIRFLIVGDGRVLYRGPWQQRGGPAVPLDVPLAGIQRLAVVCGDQVDGAGSLERIFHAPADILVVLVDKQDIHRGFPHGLQDIFLDKGHHHHQ